VTNVHNSSSSSTQSQLGPQRRSRMTSRDSQQCCRCLGEAGLCSWSGTAELALPSRIMWSAKR